MGSVRFCEPFLWRSKYLPPCIETGLACPENHHVAKFRETPAGGRECSRHFFSLDGYLSEFDGCVKRPPPWRSAISHPACLSTDLALGLL